MVSFSGAIASVVRESRGRFGAAPLGCAAGSAGAVEAGSEGAGTFSEAAGGDAASGALVCANDIGAANTAATIIKAASKPRKINGFGMDLPWSQCPAASAKDMRDIEFDGESG
jgi:hypothetical protein